tara:strand:+ start:304 stop:882 length:579 start_codon:yes stop_codon:yes gene_type:complete
MEIITMTCAQNAKVIINLDELRNNERLEGACVFKRLFNIDNEGFKEEKVNTELFKIYNIWEKDWCTFLNFIRNGRIEYDLASQYIENETERKDYQKLFMQELDSQSDSGIFLKFGPFPIFDEYVKNATQRSLNNILNKKKDTSNNPMTPEQDSLKLYDWRSSHLDIGNSGWSMTIPVKGLSGSAYWRRLKQL